MAEHRRVEPRSIMGSGMSTDPERVRDVEEDAERKARLWRERGEQSFGDVLKTAPARASLDDDEREERDARSPADEAPTGAADNDAAAAADASRDAAKGPVNAAATKPAPTKPTGPRVPPDPRARALHELLDTSRRGGKGAPMPKVGVTSETPPTGSVKSAASPPKKGTA